MGRKEAGIIGNEKIYGLQFSDDVALVADAVNELQYILTGLETYADKNRMEVNTDKKNCWYAGMTERGKIEKKI